ncbi:C40 family peptidase [Janibacter hoylei]|uniref:C40 family peptidase n=1 Tax=Janibacter hoylei TaxID=364298 RepID=UPI0021A2F61D|nr:C40 family peptidase [Janibacter hoylei]MCT1618534.1 C40 family peptidase [Janibacter hoylei]MCT2293157.1 C40 family peptidase [Janibacter hoylei]
MSHNVGRHRAAGRYNPVSELGQIVSQAGTPLAKGSAVIAASGGLIAAIAIPAQAADSTAEVDAAPVQTASAPAAPAAAVTAPATTTSSKATDAAFGKIEVEPVAKPTGPTPAQLRARAEREQARQEAAAERQREQEQEQEQAAREEQASERTESTSPSRSQERQAPAPAKSEPAPAATSSANSDVISIAKQYIGVPYVYGGSTPSGFDCSGFTQYVFAKAGKSLPRVTTAQQAAATPVSNPQPGDLVFFGSPSWHVGIYVGDGMMIDAPRTGKSISIRPIFDGVSGYGRV